MPQCEETVDRTDVHVTLDCPIGMAGPAVCVGLAGGAVVDGTGDVSDVTSSRTGRTRVRSYSVCAHTGLRTLPRLLRSLMQCVLACCAQAYLRH